jgi:hypothetical protein
VLAAGIMVAEVLVLIDDCAPYKCCIICFFTSYKKIKKLAITEAENSEKYGT